MILNLKEVAVVVVTVYICFTCYTGYVLLSKHATNTRKLLQDQETRVIANRSIQRRSDGVEWNPWGEDLEEKVEEKRLSQLSYIPPTHTVEIWSKAAIGIYLWEHIFDALVERHRNGLVTGTKRIKDIRFRYRYGGQLIPITAPQDVEYLILVLNGRSKDKIETAKVWLEFLPNFRRLKRTIAVVLGDEQCKNDWLAPFIRSRGGLLDAVFIVYDTPMVDNDEFFQWPLGVATYRGFPGVDRKKQLDVESPRQYVCNFLGTVYNGHSSSRRSLVDLLMKLGESRTKCFVKARDEWQPNETPDSLRTYEFALRLSDLTLNPVGMNTECYRIYEALALGSIPVVEDRTTPGQCASPPLRLLKEFNAPLIYVKNWQRDLPSILDHEINNMTLQEKIARRQNVVKWYEEFRLKMRDRLVDVVRRKFFTPSLADDDLVSKDEN